MARIFKEDGVLIIEGYGSMPVKRANLTISSGKVTIEDLGKKKIAFDSLWSKIRDESNNLFSDEASTLTYLTQTFNVVETDFLALYILNRDS